MRIIGALLLLVLGTSSLSHAALTHTVLLDWLNIAQGTVRALGVQNQLASRVYAGVSLSAYSALRGVKQGSAVNEDAVVAYAAHSYLTHWFPWRYNFYDLLIQTQLVNASDTELAVAKSIALPAAQSVIKATGQGYDVWADFTPAPNTSASVGKYQFTPGQTTAQYPQLAGVKTGVVSSGFASKLAASYKPLNLSSAQYRRELAFVAAYGSSPSAVRSSYDTISALFWADGGNTSAIGGHWLNISYAVLPSSLDLRQQAKFFAQFNAAASDASIVAWIVKYSALFWRPITALRNGDGTAAPQPTWTPLLATPPHPEYFSGHMATVGASYGVLKSWLKTDAVTFTIGSEGAGSAAPRTYTSLLSAALEVAESRVYGGVHFNVSGVDGFNMGVAVANEVLKKLK